MKKFTVTAFLLLMVFSVSAVMAASESKDKKAGKEKEVKQDNSLSGKVVETMNSGGYTYVLIENKGKKTWVAIPETHLTVGQHVSFQPGGEINDFQSKTLNRKFDSIIFSGGLAGQKGAGADASTVAHSAGSKGAVAPAEKIKVEKASGPNAYTVAELYQKSASLDKKKIVVKAKVVKVSAGIMGKNWVHLQDGTGDASKGTHNIVSTTQDLPSVGDVVTVNGTLYKDKDFGSGYKYNVIIEEATIKK